MDILTQAPLTFAHGWEAITAPARTTNPYTSEVTEAWFNFSQWIDRRGHVTEELYFTTREELYKLAKQAEARAEAWYHDDCTCTPESDACPACVADNRNRYGDAIPYTMTSIFVECPECAGDGKIDVYGTHSLYSTQPNIHTVNCPTCDGNGKVEA